MRHLHKAFTMIELVMIIIVVGILTAVAIPKFSTNELSDATHQVIRHLRYTQHLAMTDEKYQAQPQNTSDSESYRTRFWFKQWWHYRITDSNDVIFSMIFSDSSTDSSSSTFNIKITNSQDDEIAIDPLTKKYLVGNYQENNGDYPPQAETDQSMNLSETFNITNVVVSNTKYTSSSMSGGATGFGHRISVLFDSLGRPYFDEGVAGGGASDDNPYDSDERLPLQEEVYIQLTHSSGESSRICIQPYTGYIYDCTP